MASLSPLLTKAQNQPKRPFPVKATPRIKAKQITNQTKLKAITLKKILINLKRIKS